MKLCHKCGILTENLEFHNDDVHTDWATAFDNDPWNGEPDQDSSVSVRPSPSSVSSGKKVAGKKTEVTKVPPAASSSAKKVNASASTIRKVKQVKFEEQNHDTTIELSDSEDEKEPKRRFGSLADYFSEASKEPESDESEDCEDGEEGKSNF